MVKIFSMAFHFENNRLYLTPYRRGQKSHTSENVEKEKSAAIKNDIDLHMYKVHGRHTMFST